MKFGDIEGPFESISAVRESISKHCDIEKIKEVELGYIEHGHGAKGKKIWLNQDSDLKEMYAGAHKRNAINLWCFREVRATTVTKGKKRARSPEQGKGRTTNYESHNTRKMARVDEIFEELQEIHTEFSAEQLRAWAHMVELGKHKSLEEPPDKPFFRGTKCTSSNQTAVSAPVASPATVNPLSMRTELINQLEKWHRLYEVRAISSEDYEHLKSTILMDISNV